MSLNGGSIACTTPDDLEIFNVFYESLPPEQGDILFSCPYIYPHIKDGKLQTWRAEWDIMILGHSCDIENVKVDLVPVCPIWEINQYRISCAERLKLDVKYQSRFKNAEDFKKKVGDTIKDASKGDLFAYTVLKGVPLKEGRTEPFLVDFANTYSLSLDSLNEFSKTDENKKLRARLKTDYKTDLIGKFNYFLSRAALPTSDFNYKKNIKKIIDDTEVDKILSSVGFWQLP